MEGIRSRIAKLTDVRIGGQSPFGPVFKLAEPVLAVLSMVVAAMSRARPENYPEWLSKPIDWVQTGWLLPAVLVATPLATVGRKMTDRSKHRLVKGLLDEICRQTFNNEAFEHEQHRRVTLFKHRNFCWRRWPFFGGFLVPIERSGESTRKTGSIFHAPDDGEDCTGVAGRVWSKRNYVYVKQLPDLKRNCDDASVSEYAEKTFMNARGLKRRPPQARALFGIPVDVGHSRWGVIVIDTVNTEIRTKSAKMIFKKLASPLSSFLKEL